MSAAFVVQYILIVSSFQFYFCAETFSRINCILGSTDRMKFLGRDDAFGFVGLFRSMDCRGHQTLLLCQQMKVEVQFFAEVFKLQLCEKMLMIFFSNLLVPIYEVQMVESSQAVFVEDGRRLLVMERCGMPE